MLLTIAILGSLMLVPIGFASTSDVRVGAAPPPPPSGVSGTALSDTEVALAWTPVVLSKGGVLHYVVYRDGAQVGTTVLPSFTDSGLAPSTEYRYKVSTVDLKGAEGKKSKEVKVTTLATPTDNTPPTAPTGLQASASAPDRVDLSWQPAADPESGIDHYRLYRDGTFATTTTGTSISDAGLQAATGYTYAVSAVNGAGLEGAPSASVSTTTPRAPDTTPPTPPTGVAASPLGPRRIDLSWSPSSDPESGISTYRVYRDGALIGPTAGTRFADSVGIAPRTSYTYEITALNGDGLESGPSVPATAVTPADIDTTPPAAPGRPRIIR